IASLTKFLPVQEGGVIASSTRSLESFKAVGRGGVTEIKALVDLIEIGSRYRRFGGLNALFNSFFGLKHMLRNGRPYPTMPVEPDEQPNDDHALDPRLI